MQFSQSKTLDLQFSQSRISYLIWCDLLIFYERRKGIRLPGESAILPIKIGKGGSYFGKDDMFLFLCNRFSDLAAVGSTFLFRWRRGDWFLEEHLLI